jgi:hypothetical protein
LHNSGHSIVSIAQSEYQRANARQNRALKTSATKRA